MKDSSEFLIKSRITFAKRANTAAAFFLKDYLPNFIWCPSSTVSFYLGTFAAKNFERLCFDKPALNARMGPAEGATLILLWKEINLQQTKKGKSWK